MDFNCIEWALTVLNYHDYRIENVKPEMIQSTPWSCVYRFSTHQGHCYLKQVPPALSIEIDIIKILQTRYSAPVPVLIADHPTENCFLMQDAGIPLREFFKRDFNADVLITAINHYIVMQRATASDITLFLDIGVPDWRLAQLPRCYQELIQQETLLTSDGLTVAELKKLPKLTSQLAALCQQLSDYAIPETFSHSDFHDNNILINPNTQKTTLIDIGEVAITHPFFSLLNILYRAQETYKLTKSQYQLLQHRALQSWYDIESEGHVLKIMSLIQRCWSIDAVLAEYRLLTSINSASFDQLIGQGRLSKKLRVWIAQNT